MTIRDRAAETLTRRHFLKYTSAGAATAAATASVASAAPTPIPLNAREQFLLDRLTFGRTPAMAAEMRTRGYKGFLKWQLQLPGENPIDDSGLFALPDTGTGFPGGPVYLENPGPAELWGLSVAEILSHPTYGPFPTGANTTIGQSPQIIILGGHHAEHQARWVMTDFMQNVHNTYIRQPLQYLSWAPMLHDVIHEHALGSYPTLTEASAKSAGMMNYLGQFLSDKDHPNENYARELMELYTVGVKNHLGIRTFMESDVAEAAKILTGWDWKTALTSELGDFKFTSSKHTPGDKFISLVKDPVSGTPPKAYPGPLGTAGVAEGEDFIRDLCAHPLCALHITYRMIQWFLGDDVEHTYYKAWIRAATRFFLTGGDVKLTLLELFDEGHFHEIYPGRFEKVRRPLNLTIALKRSLQATIDLNAPSPFEWLVQDLTMGQVPGAWPAPNGYQPQNAKWTQSMRARLDFLNDVFFGDNGLDIDDAYLATLLPSSAHISQWPELANQHVFGGCLTPSDVAGISAQLGQSMGSDAQRRRETFFLTFAAPSYQFLC